MHPTFVPIFSTRPLCTQCNACTELWRNRCCVQLVDNGFYFLVRYSSTPQLPLPLDDFHHALASTCHVCTWQGSREEWGIISRYMTVLHILLLSADSHVSLPCYPHSLPTRGTKRTYLVLPSVVSSSSLAKDIQGGNRLRMLGTRNKRCFVTGSRSAKLGSSRKITSVPMRWILYALHDDIMRIIHLISVGRTAGKRFIRSI